MKHDPATIDSFVVCEPLPVITADRSTLQRAATCPAQARLVDSGMVNDASHIANVGEAVHVALSAAVQAYIDLASEGEIMRPAMLADIVRTELRQARPDVQPDAIAAAMHTAWAFASFISDLHPLNILRFDGGTGDRSGQLAWDIDGLGVRVTSELDLLLATESTAVLRECDYKSGWKRWTVSEVAKSFQFQCHAWLVLNNYPDVACLEVSVWDIRRNSLTYPVQFERRDLKEWHARIASAAGEYVRYRNTPPQDAPVWPAVEKCGICPAAALCPAARHTDLVTEDPAKFVRILHGLESAVDSLHQLGNMYVEQYGDIVTPEGLCYGANKPKSERKPTKQLYTIKQEANGESQE